MESLSFIPLTVASVLSSFTGTNGTVEEAVISTHTSPEIAGLWELDLQATPDFADTKDSAVKAGQSKEMQDLLAAIKESSRASQAADDALAKAQSQAAAAGDVQARQDLLAKDSCRERYNFGADSALITTSGAEWTYGKYVYQHQEEGLPIIAITTTYDNNEPDCSGRQVDQKGEAIIAFVDYQPEQSKMRWCIDKDGDNCFMTFHKLRP